MSTLKLSIVSAALASLLTTCPVMATNQAGAPVRNENLAAPVVPPLFLIAPTEVRSDPTLAKGCWVRLFPEPDYKGLDDLTIAGPVDLPSLHTPAGGVDWKHKTESVIVGPRATVAVYENGNYSHQTATLQPGTREPRLRGNLKFTQSIDSLRVRCNEGKP